MQLTGHEPTAAVAARRFSSQAVTAPLPDPAAVVGRLLAVQAQDLPAATWAVSLRCGASRDEVERALDDGRIVRTWPMRGTLHLVPARDVRWLLALAGSRLLAASGRRLAALQLDERTIERCADHLRGALAGRRLGRDELLAELDAFGVSTEGQRGYHLVWQLAHRGLVAQAGARFALLDDLVPDRRAWPRDEALAELARRYFAGHGPATEADLGWWSGLPLRDVRQGIALAGLRAETIGGVEMFGGDVEAGSPGVHLLPGFDELLLGYRNRSAVLDPAHADKVCPGANGVFRGTVAIGGRMVATWKLGTSKKAPIAFHPFDDQFDPAAVADLATAYLAWRRRPEPPA